MKSVTIESFDEFEKGMIERHEKREGWIQREIQLSKLPCDVKPIPFPFPLSESPFHAPVENQTIAQIIISQQGLLDIINEIRKAKLKFSQNKEIAI